MYIKENNATDLIVFRSSWQQMFSRHQNKICFTFKFDNGLTSFRFSFLLLWGSEPYMSCFFKKKINKDIQVTTTKLRKHKHEKNVLNWVNRIKDFINCNSTFVMLQFIKWYTFILCKFASVESSSKLTITGYGPMLSSALLQQPFTRLLLNFL